MATYFVETYRPAYPEAGVHFRTTRAEKWSLDTVHPCMTAVFQVDLVKSKDEAIACVIEKLAGFNPAVTLVHGGKIDYNLRQLAKKETA